MNLAPCYEDRLQGRVARGRRTFGAIVLMTRACRGRRELIAGNPLQSPLSLTLSREALRQGRGILDSLLKDNAHRERLRSLERTTDLGSEYFFKSPSLDGTWKGHRRNNKLIRDFR